MIERVTNLTIILISLICGAAVVKNTFFPSAPVGTGQSSALRGQKVKLEGASDQRVAIVLALSSHCQYCQKSLPFYQKIRSWQTGQKAFSLVVIGSEPKTDLEHYLHEKNLDTDGVHAMPDALNIAATPTVLLFKDGVIVESWFGQLDQSGEASVAKALKRVCPDCRVTT